MIKQLCYALGRHMTSRATLAALWLARSAALGTYKRTGRLPALYRARRISEQMQLVRRSR